MKGQDVAQCEAATRMRDEDPWHGNGRCLQLDRSSQPQGKSWQAGTLNQPQQRRQDRILLHCAVSKYYICLFTKCRACKIDVLSSSIMNLMFCKDCEAHAERLARTMQYMVERFLHAPWHAGAAHHCPRHRDSVPGCSVCDHSRLTDGPS